MLRIQNSIKPKPKQNKYNSKTLNVYKITAILFLKLLEVL